MSLPLLVRLCGSGIGYGHRCFGGDVVRHGIVVVVVVEEDVRAEVEVWGAGECEGLVGRCEGIWGGERGGGEGWQLWG